MPRDTSKRERRISTRGTKNKKVAELSEPKMPEKRQRKAINTDHADYTQTSNTHFTSEEVNQEESDYETNDQSEQDQISEPQDQTSELQYQEQPSNLQQNQILIGADRANCALLTNHNPQICYILELPFVNKHETVPSIDSLDESRKHNQPISYNNDALILKPYLIANPIYLPYSANHFIADHHSANYHIPNYLDQPNIINNYQNNQTSLVNQHTHTSIPNQQELLFVNEAALVDWLRTRQDLISQAQKSSSAKRDYKPMAEIVMDQCKLLFLRIRYPSTEIRETLVEKIAYSLDPSSKELKDLKKKSYVFFNNFRYAFNRDLASSARALLSEKPNPNDEDIKQLSGEIWQRKLNRYLDVTDYEEFKKSISFKYLEIMMTESLKFHVEYLIAIRNKEIPAYQQIVLDRIRALDQLTAHISVPSASQYNYVNDLNLDINLNNNDDD